MSRWGGALPCLAGLVGLGISMLGAPAFARPPQTSDAGVDASDGGDDGDAGESADASSHDENRVYVRPIDGVSDDWPNLFGNIVPAAIAAGQTVVMLPGRHGEEWQMRSYQVCPNGATIRATPETVINADVAVVGTYSAAFAAIDFANGPETALETDAIYGATTLVSPVSFEAGETFFVYTGGAQNAGSQYTSQGVTGSGPYTITLDRPIAFSFYTVEYGTWIAWLSPAHDVNIDGRGALLKGPNVPQLFATGQARDSSIKNFVVDLSPGTANGAINLDTGSVRLLAENIQITTTDTTYYALDISSIENSTLRNISAIGLPSNSGFEIETSANIEIENCATSGFSVGMAFFGSNACHVRGGSYSDCVNIAISLDAASSNVSFEGGESSNNASLAFYSNAAGVRVDDWVANDNAVFAYYIVSGDFHGSNLTCTGNNVAVVALADTTIHGFTSITGSASDTDFIAEGDATTRLRVTDYQATTSYSNVLVHSYSAMDVELSGQVSCLAGAPGFLEAQGADNIDLHDLQFSGANADRMVGVGLVNAATVLHLGDGIDWGAIPTTSRVVELLGPGASGTVDSGPVRLRFESEASITAASTEDVPPWPGEFGVTTDGLGIVMRRAGRLTQMSISFTGDSANAEGQTVTETLTQNGIPVAGAKVAGLPTTAGVNSGSVIFGPMEYAAGDVFRLTLTPSATLSAPVTAFVMDGS